MLAVRNCLPTFSFAAEARIAAAVAQSEYRCRLALHRLFHVTCSQSTENRSPITFDLSQFFSPIVDYAEALYDALADEVFRIGILDLEHFDYDSLLQTLDNLIFQVRDDVLPVTSEQATGPVISPVSASDLFENALGTFDHALCVQLESRVSEEFSRVDDPENGCRRMLAESLRKRLALRNAYWLKEADTRIAEVGTAAENEGREASVIVDWISALVARAPQEFRNGRDAKKPVRRHAKQEAIDTALREISKSLPKSHEEVFQSLEGRTKSGYPDREPFRTAGGWWKGFRKDPPAARAWLSKNWTQLDLPPFARGPKKVITPTTSAR
jgi:hypothetical protein